MRYTSDLTDTQWEMIKEYFPAGNKSKYDSKVFHSYDCEIKKSKRNDELKRLMLGKIIIQQNKKGISNYKIYNTLKLNPSNVNFFLKNRNTTKLSLSNVEKIYDFVKTYHNK